MKTKIKDRIGKVEEEKKFDQMHLIPSVLSSLAFLEVQVPTKSPLE